MAITSASTLGFSGNAKQRSLAAAAAANMPKATVLATTGAPTIDTVSRPGKTIYRFLGSGSITVTAGVCEALVIAGGGGVVGVYGGGAGGYIERTAFFLQAGTYTVTVGAGGNTTPSRGGNSQLGEVIKAWGGGGGVATDSGLLSVRSGGSGGGGTTGTGAGGPGVYGQGNDGGSQSGGGSSAAGSAGVGGAGTASSITGTSVTRAAGGSASGNANGGANTGDGAGGPPSGSTAFSGGSGLVVVVIG